MRIISAPCVFNDLQLSSKCGVVAASACRLYARAGHRLLSSQPYPTVCSHQPQPGLRCYHHLPASSSARYTISTPPSALIMTRTGGTSSNTRLTKSNTTQRVRTYSQSQSRRSSMYRTSVHGSSTTLQLSWLLRTNSPTRRGRLPNDIQKRSIFGMGEIIGVLANPADTLRSLAESKRMLEETRRELAEARERAQLTPTHTFSPLPGFFDRPAEIRTLEKALEVGANFTVLFGASSVGKTALLRQVLTSTKYHVLHFDLRIAGFADLPSLYMSMSQQMESFFMGIARDPELPGYEDFEKQAWGFKHDRLSVERRLSNAMDGQGSGPLSEIKTSDIARLMELFQSSLLKYWNFNPAPQAKKSSESTPPPEEQPESKPQRRASRMRFFWQGPKSKDQKKSKNAQRDSVAPPKPSENGQAQEPPQKKIPVFFIDEAHKLPSLIRSTATMKCLLDAMLVLTKQDRLCHVIHATSDPFYQTWLRQLNVMQHCKIITIGDYPKHDTRKFFRERILPGVPAHLRRGLDFEVLYEAFGGKIAHWQDYVSDYVNANGRLDVKSSSHFLQAYALLNLHVIHSAQAQPNEDEQELGSPRQVAPNSPNNVQANGNASQSNLLQRAPSHAPLSSGTGFRIYSPLMINADPHDSPTTFSPAGMGTDSTADFTALQLLKVMNRLAQPGTRALSYFHLCREMGVRAIDGMVRGRILDLRWTDPVSREGWDPRIQSTRVMSMPARESLHGTRLPAASSSGTVVNEIDQDEDGLGMVPLSEDEMFREEQRQYELQGVEEEEGIVGPKLVPITPIMRFAMREVVLEYYDEDSAESEYASLPPSEVDEY